MEVLANQIRQRLMKKGPNTKKPRGTVPAGRRTPPGSMGGMDPALRATPPDAYKGKSFYSGSR